MSPVHLYETDRGTKDKAIKRFERIFSDPEWNALWDEWWSQVEADVIAMCPVDTGALASTIRVVSASQVGAIREAPTFGATSIMVSPDIQFDERAIVAGDPSVINPKTGQGVVYAGAVHDGHITRVGTWVPPRPFLSHAILLNMPQLRFMLENYVKKELGKGGSN